MNTNEPGEPKADEINPIKSKQLDPLTEQWIKPSEPIITEDKAPKIAEDNGPGCAAMAGYFFIGFIIIVALLFGTCLLSLR